MRLCNLIIRNKIALGLLYGDRIVDLTATARGVGYPIDGSCVEDLLVNWQRSVEHIREGVGKAVASGALIFFDGAPTFAPPVRRPGTFRDFYAFEQHVRNARRLRGLDIAPEWFKFPVFYFSNPNSITTTGAEIRFPKSSTQWDYELEIGAVLGGEGSDLTPHQAEKLIAGYVVLNDWSARDIQRQEMAVSLGPAKGKDFATSISPWLATPDELADRRQGKGYNLRATAKINNQIFSDSNWNSIHYSLGEMIARASQDARVYAGELFGSGTVGMGCLLERGSDHNLWLKSGDVVELEIERLGKLINRVA